MISINEIPEDKIVFYDIETTGVYPVYCDMKMLAYQLGINSEPMLVDPNNREEQAKFRKLVKDPQVYKVGYNNINFDDIVLWRYGFYVHPSNRHDMYLAVKTVHPMLPAYGLKYVSWVISGDYHKPMRQLTYHMKRSSMEQEDMYQAPPKLLGEYCLHDVRQTVVVFRELWEAVQSTDPPHWLAYTQLELSMGEPLHEMMLLGREYINIKECRDKIAYYKEQREGWLDLGREWGVENVTSALQIDNMCKRKGWPRLVRSKKDNPLLTKYDRLQDIDSWDKEEDRPRFGIVRKNNPVCGQGGAFDAVAMSKLEDKIRKVIKGKWKLESIDNYDPRMLATDCKERLEAAGYEASKYTKIISYFRSYLRAGKYERRRGNGSNNKGRESGFRISYTPINFEASGNRGEDNRSETTNTNYIYIPKGYGISAARTRRFRSGLRGSYIEEVEGGKIVERIFGINAQNQTKESKSAQKVPLGWIAWYIDSTQIENVAHIYFSRDETRRLAYEADINWNEYVWLYEQAYQESITKELLDDINSMPSPINPNWSMYKQFKTVKLALNFGMGIAKFSKITGLERKLAEKAFEDVHRACPAIRKLVEMTKNEIHAKGYCIDPFGHIYSGVGDNMYKIVAYRVQGCGTGSCPKAMTVANWQTLRRLDSPVERYYPCIRHPYTRKFMHGVLTGTTHDECAGRLSLGLPAEKIIITLRELLYNMEQKFSNKFTWKDEEGEHKISLRAKLAVSITNAADQKEISHNKPGFEEALLAMIAEGKRKSNHVINYSP